MYRIAFIVVAVLALALGLLVGTLNSDTVSVDLLWIQLQWPLGLLLLCIFAVGLLFGLLVSWFFGIVPLRARLRKARNLEP
ncbi:MAG: LapA family protein [Xanthomonadales bacterium]|nr:LapA family protein [Xanthomonadales bacterium]MDH3940550.1 LapA family protein [Xanthomonadales bacterium]MDH4002075.1 LapA family protein [Xanthomonadales bacterium]